MRRHLAIGLAWFTLFAIFALSPQLVAQEQSGLQASQTHHTHYKSSTLALSEALAVTRPSVRTY
jgi:hypothetical protein